MSTTLLTLECDPTIMRELFSDVFDDKFSSADLKALKKTVAKAVLQEDLYQDFKIEPDIASDLTDLDGIIDKYSVTFKNALMYLQCYYYFKQNDDVEGLNAKRMHDCYNDYMKIRAKFPDMKTENVSTTTIATISRG